MATRLKLHEHLKSLCDNVYFQEPENVKMQYPAIVYNPNGEQRKFANNGTYGLVDGYDVTIIDRDPDSPVRHAFRMLLPLTDFDRAFRTDGLNHFQYTLYY